MAAGDTPMPIAGRPKVAAVILAAGRSTRMGDANKLLMDINGAPMIGHVLNNVTAAKIDHILLVTGYQSEVLTKAIAGFDVGLIHNIDFASGLASSLKAGVAALEHEVAGALILLGDMPLVDADVINRLVDAFNQTSDICVPVFDAEQGNPVLWGRDYFDEMLMLTGDRGAKGLLSKHQNHVKVIDVDTQSILRDFDEPSDFNS